MAHDLYQVLGVGRDATEADLKKAYRRLAMQYHPDRNNGEKAAEEKFKEVVEAYEILHDPETRARYDRFGLAGVKRGPAPGGFGFGQVDLAEALNIFMRDFGGLGGFDAFFGGGQRARRAQRRGQDLRATIRVTLADVATGVSKALRVRTFDRCSRCGASGAEPGTSAVRCPTCGGAGEVRRASHSLFGQLVSVSPCPTCGAEGTVISTPCTECGGEGRVRAEREVQVDVPPGVAQNHYITLRGQGLAGPRNGPPGDLLVEFEIEDDPRFERRGDDLVYTLPLSFSQAGLGADVKVPTPYGEERLSLPAGTQSGTVFTLRGKGLPNVGDGRRGVLYVRTHVWTPTRLTGELKAVLQGLSEVEGDPPKDERQGRRLWDKVKEAFGT